MKKFFTFITLFVSIACLVAFAGTDSRQVKETLMIQSPGQFSPAQYMSEQKETYDWLMAEAVELSAESFITIHVSEAEMNRVDGQSCATCGDNKKLLVGVAKNVDTPISFVNLRPRHLAGAAVSQSHGMIRGMNDGGFVWTMAVESQGATALRVHLKKFNLPENASLYIYNMNGEAFGPYNGRGPNKDGDFWTNTVTGEVAYLQIRYNGPVSTRDLKAINFNVADVAHLGSKFLVPFLEKPWEPRDNMATTESFCSFNASCVQNAACYSSSNYAPIATHKYAIAHMQFVSGAYIYICTGGLINNTKNDFIPYFLTANHCISRASEASSLECYFQFWTATCNGACYDPVSVCPRTVGATIKATSSKTGDFTLMQLSQTPPAGSTFLGWTATAVANTNGVALYRLSHPQGAPLAFSKHTVSTSAGVCRSWPRGKWIYSKDNIGATEGGSSGSPVCNASGQVVGQLSGGCGTNLNDVCDATRNSTVDGAFAAYYSLVSAYLSPL